MTQIDTDISLCRKKLSKYTLKHKLTMDMTPMVDLGFLLISFFVIVTRLTTPTVMPLIMPKVGPPMFLGESNSLTIMLTSANGIFVYAGEWDDAFSKGWIMKTENSLNGLGRIISEKQNQLDHSTKSKEGRDGLMMLIKADKSATYANVVSVLDQATIHLVKKYAIVKPTEDELAYLKRHQ